MADLDQYVVIANPQLNGARSVVHVDALADWERRGFVPVGPSSSLPSTVGPHLTVGEADAAAADEAAHAADVMSQPSAPAKPRKQAAPRKSSTSSRQASAAKPKE